LQLRIGFVRWLGVRTASNLLKIDYWDAAVAYLYAARCKWCA